MKETQELPAGPSAAPFLEVVNVVKSFGGVHALKGVSLSLGAGEVHGLVGANGAGKSTLIRILAGLVQPDGGEVRLGGAPVNVHSPQHSTALGMSFIHQELAFVPDMSVIENLMLGIPKRSRFGMIDWRAIARDVEPLAQRVGITAPLFGGVKGLSTAENWLISICRALIRKARLIVMDEPTASLSASESEKLFAIIGDLARSGVAVLYVTHRLDEVLRMCRRATVFRDGRSTAHLEGRQLTRTALVESIVGGVVEHVDRPAVRAGSGQVILEVKGLTRLPKVRDVSFELHRGEVLGIGGLVGAGRTELARLLFGVDRIDGGTMALEGRPYAPRGTAQAVQAGVGLVPEERRADGLILTKSLAFNLSLSNLARLVHSRFLPLVDRRKRESLALSVIRDLAIKTPGTEVPVGRLSGGNQQKVVIGRWLLHAPKVLILDEPTRGVDVGARAEIHRLIRDLAADGMAALVISSEPDEQPDLCDRVLVMCEGQIVQELRGATLTRNAIVGASYAHHTRAEEVRS